MMNSQEEIMEQQLQEVRRLRSQLSDMENMNEEMRNMIASLEMENEKKEKLLAAAKKKLNTEVVQLNEKASELESKNQELQEVISNLKLANINKAEEPRISAATKNLEELVSLEAEKYEAENKFSVLTKTTEELHTQHILLTNEMKEVSTEISELKSKLALTVEECSMSNEKLEALQEESLLLKVELETFKGKAGSHLSKGNSLFAEVEDGRQQMKNEAKELKEQLSALQKSHSHTSLEVRKLMKENAKMYEELERAREQRSTEELKLQLTEYKQRKKDLEAAQKEWEEEKAAEPIVCGHDNETGMFYDNLLREERAKTKQVKERYDDIMARYIAATEEVVAIKREVAIMESMKLHAEAEIAKLNLELLKKERGDLADL